MFTKKDWDIATIGAGLIMGALFIGWLLGLPTPV